MDDIANELRELLKQHAETLWELKCIRDCLFDPHHPEDGDLLIQIDGDARKVGDASGRFYLCIQNLLNAAELARDLITLTQKHTGDVSDLLNA